MCSFVSSSMSESLSSSISQLSTSLSSLASLPKNSSSVSNISLSLESHFFLGWVVLVKKVIKLCGRLIIIVAIFIFLFVIIPQGLPFFLPSLLGQQLGGVLLAPMVYLLEHNGGCLHRSVNRVATVGFHDILKRVFFEALRGSHDDN